MTMVKLGDVAREYKATLKDSSGLPSVGLEHFKSGDLELAGWDESGNNTFTKGFKRGHLLFGRRRAYLEKAAIAPFDGVCSGDIIVIEPIDGKIHKELLPFVIQNDKLFDFAMSKSAGGLSPRVKWADLKEYEFDLPDETDQASLSRLLKAAYLAKKEYQNLIHKTDALVKSQFIEMFDTQTDWKSMQLKDLFDLQMGKTPPRADLQLWQSNDYRWISIADMSKYGKYTSDTSEYLSEKAVKETGIKIVPKDTVIMSFKLTIGRTAITSEDIYTNEAIMAFLPKENCFNNDYLRYALSFYDWNADIQNAVKGATLNKAIIGEARFRIPPKELQNEFASFVDQCDKSKFELQKSIEATDQLIRSLLHEGVNKN